MHTQVPAIRLKEGFGSLPFGAGTDEALRLFGSPDETGEMDTGEDYRSLVWHYWDKGFTLFFDLNNNTRFCCAEIDEPSATLWDVRIFELTESELKKLMQAKGYTQLDEEKEAWGEKRISFDDADIDFYFENGKLISVNYSVPVQIPAFVILPN